MNTTTEHRLNPEDDEDQATITVPVYDDGEGQALTDWKGAAAIVAAWEAQGDAERSWAQTIGNDLVLATWDGSDLSQFVWSEAGYGTYYLNDAPVVRA